MKSGPGQKLAKNVDLSLARPNADSLPPTEFISTGIPINTVRKKCRNSLGAIPLGVSRLRSSKSHHVRRAVQLRAREFAEAEHLNLGVGQSFTEA